MRGLKTFLGLAAAALLFATPASASSHGSRPVRPNHGHDARALRTDGKATGLLGAFDSQEAWLHAPAGTRLLVFDEGHYGAYDAHGRKLSESRGAMRLHATTLHDGVDLRHHQLLTEGPRGEIYLSVPDGTRHVHILQNQELFDGRIEALDARGRVLASEDRTDARLVPVDTNPLACAISMRLLTTTRDRDAYCFRVPAGTRCLHLEGVDIRSDGSILALDRRHRALAIQSGWNGYPEVRRGGSKGGQGLVHNTSPGVLYVRVVRGTRFVWMRGGSIRLLDARGRVLAHQDGYRVILHERDTP